MLDLSSLSRRDLLRRAGALTAAGVVAPLLPACADATDDAPSPTAGPMAGRPAAGAADALAAARLHALEQRHGARLGVYAVNHRTGHNLAHRADERFAFCSSYKGLLAAHVLHRHGSDTAYMNRIVRYGKSDLRAAGGGFITPLYISTGMTIWGLCQAAVAYSDDTAANLLVGLTGGPHALTAYLRSIGDTVTRSDRTEPALNTAIPGDPRRSARHDDAAGDRRRPRGAAARRRALPVRSTAAAILDGRGCREHRTVPRRSAGQLADRRQDGNR